MTRYAASQCLYKVCDENVDRSSAVVARLKGAAKTKLNNNLPCAAATTTAPSESTELRHARTMRDDCACVSGTSGVEDAVPATKPPIYDVFLGGSCGTTVWRRQLVIPFLKKRAISYYDPQRSVWSESMIYEESIAKENSSLFLFVIDPATVNATSFLEIAYFAARKSPKLVVVFLGKTEWAEKAHPADVPDRNRTCQLLDRILEAHNVPMLHNINDALAYIEEEIIGSKKWTDVISVPSQRLTYLSLRTKRAARAAQIHAKDAWTRMRAVATKASIAGAADAAILLLCQMVVPTVPIYLIIIPLLLLNAVVVVAATKWQKVRAARPRSIVDSSIAFPQRTAAAIPSPRMVTVTTPLNPKQNKLNVTRSKRFCDDLVVDDGSASFFVPESLRQKNFQLQPVEVPRQRVVELVSSSVDHVDWVAKSAIPLLDRNGLSYSKCLASSGLSAEMRMACLKTWSSQRKQFLYHIPETRTFLSGMVEVAYMLGHSDWEVTLCVPKIAEILDHPPSENEEEVDRSSRRRRNDCYQIAFCYLKDMAKRRQCRVFGDLDEALRHAGKVLQEA